MTLCILMNSFTEVVECWVLSLCSWAEADNSSSPGAKLPFTDPVISNTEPELMFL